MSDQDVERVMMLTSCSEEEARQTLSKTGNVIDAIDVIMCVPITRGAPKQKAVSEEQAAFAKLRKNMEAIECSVQNNITTSNQPGSSSQALTHNPALAQEEMTLRSDYTQSSQIPTQAEEEQTQGTVCQ